MGTVGANLLAGHSGINVRSVAVSSDEKRIASGPEVRIWDSVSGK
jgi:hypothetical protein